MFEGFKKVAFGALNILDSYGRIKDREQLNKEIGPITLENASKWFGYGPNEKFGFFDLQSRYFEWRKESFDGSTMQLLRMGRAFDYFYYSAEFRTNQHPTPEESAFMDQTETMWRMIPKKQMEYDDAKVLFFSHCFKPAPREELIGLFPKANPLEITYLFHSNREKCSSLEFAQQFDRAYYELFTLSMSISGHKFIDHPYSPILEGKLEKPFPLPGVDIKLTPPQSNQSEPVIAEDSSQTVVEESSKPSSSDEPNVAEMSIEDARGFFRFDTNDEFTQEELWSKNRKLKEKNKNSQEVLKDLALAYEVLSKIAV